MNNTTQSALFGLGKKSEDTEHFTGPEWLEKVDPAEYEKLV